MLPNVGLDLSFRSLLRRRKRLVVISAWKEFQAYSCDVCGGVAKGLTCFSGVVRDSNGEVHHNFSHGFDGLPVL